MYYIYNKANYFAKDCFFINILKKRQINTILKNNTKVQKDIKEEKIAIDQYISKLSLNNQYFSVKTSKNLFNILNIKKFIRIPDLQNLKKQ